MKYIYQGIIIMIMGIICLTLSVSLFKRNRSFKIWSSWFCFNYSWFILGSEVQEDKSLTRLK